MFRPPRPLSATYCTKLAVTSRMGSATCHVAPSGEGKGTTSTCVATQEGRAHLPKCNEEHLVVRVLPSKHREIWVRAMGYFLECLYSECDHM